MSYESNNYLFRSLTEVEVETFKKHASEFCQEGFKIETLAIIHPVVRHEVIRLIQASLKEQGLHACKVNVVVGVFQGVCSDVEAFSTPEKAQEHKEKLAPDYRNKGDVVISCVEVDKPTQ